MELLPRHVAPTHHAGVAGVAIGFMLIEYGIARLARRDAHDLRESAASFGVAAGQSLIRVLEAGALAIPFAFVQARRITLSGDEWIVSGARVVTPIADEAEAARLLKERFDIARP